RSAPCVSSHELVRRPAPARSAPPLPEGERIETPTPTSARLPERDRLRGAEIADLDVAFDHALAAVLEGHLGADACARGAVVQRRHQRRVTLGDEAAPHLARAGELAVVG